MSTATVEYSTKKSSHEGYVGARISRKTAKLFLAKTPKHGPVKRETMKFYMDLTTREPGAMRPKFQKKTTKVNKNGNN